MTAAAVPVRRRGRLRLSDRPIRGKLAVWAIVPLAAIVTLALLIGISGASDARDAGQALRLVSVGETAGELTAQLQRERAAAAAVFAQSSRPAAIEGYRTQSEATDAVVARFLAGQRDLDAPTGLAAPLQRLDIQVAALPLLREQVRSGQDATGSLTIFRYRALTADLGAYRAALSQLGVTAQTANELRASATLSQAIENLGLLQVAVLPAIGEPSVTAAQQQQIVGATATFNDAMESFAQIAPDRWQAQLAGQASTKAALAGERLQGVAARAQADAPLDLGTSAAGWVTATNARMQQLHAAEHQFDADLVGSVTRQRDQQRRNLLYLAIGVAVVLATAGVAGWWVTVSITRPLRALQGEATAAADTYLPEVVARLANGGQEVSSPAELVAELMGSPPREASDEVSAVRRAFIGVFVTALHLAGQQATARKTADQAAQQEAAARQIADQFAAQQATARAAVLQIVTNVARRLQGLVDQLMKLIDVLEQAEEDPARLDKIYPVDHQANQSKRYISNLLILANQYDPPPLAAAVSLYEVVRAAAGRLQAYKQVEVGVDARIMIHRNVVEKLVHLLTEVVSNGLDFSPPQRIVEVVADVLRDSLRVAVIDYGYGIRPEVIPDLLRQIREPELDAQAVKQMGLVVVGRLTAQLGIGVDIRSGEEPGTVVELRIPQSLFTVEEPVWVPAQPAPAAAMERGAPPAAPANLPAAPLPVGATQALTTADATEQFPVIGGPTRSGDWATPTAETVIFQQVVNDNPWFSAKANATQPLPKVVPEWPPMPTTSATSRPDSSPSGVLSTTRSGLPKRVPSAPPTKFAGAPLISSRDPKTTSNKLAAFAAATRASRAAS